MNVNENNANNENNTINIEESIKEALRETKSRRKC